MGFVTAEYGGCYKETSPGGHSCRFVERRHSEQRTYLGRHPSGFFGRRSRSAGAFAIQMLRTVSARLARVSSHLGAQIRRVRLGSSL